MQNKGAIRLFAILLVLASIYSLSFTYFTWRVEKKATEIATDKNGELNLPQMNEYLDSMRSEPGYLFDLYTYGECKEKEINLGLDLKGGMNVTLEISVIDLIKTLSVDPNDTVIVRTIERAQKMQESSGESFVSLFGKAFNELYPNANLANYFATLNNKDVLSYNSTNEEVISYLDKEAQSAIDNSFNILRTRIDRFGVTQPNIQSLGSGRILVELPGVKEPARVRKLLQGTAQLEFWETYDSKEIYQYLAQANQIVSDLNKLEAEKNGTTDSTAKTDTTAKAETALSALEASVTDTQSVKKDTTDLSLAEQMAKDTTKKDTTIDQSKDLALFSKLMITPDGQNLFSGPVAGVSHIKDTAAVNAYLSLEQVKRVFPKDLKFYWTIKSFDDAGNLYQLIAIRVPKDGKAPLDGDAISNASIDYGQTGTRAGVSMNMHAEGAQVWARLTKENIGKSIAIVLDGYVYSFPTVQNEISGGSSSITGNFTINEARDLSNVLKSGKLPAPAKIVEEAVVGPSLGKESVRLGFISFVIAFILVLLYMIFYYSKAGLVANVALFVNVFLIVGVLASFGAVLTLPGIAGLVITLGMAVDANVIIYERIREELRAGKGVKLAVADGYKHAMSAIIDGNVTTMLTGVILFIFGSGPIQGFATTLIIGILTSLFCGIFISRIMFETMLNKNWNVSLGNKLTNNIFVNANYKILEKRYLMYVFSAIIIGAGIISIFVRGWDYGVDFKGGRTYIIEFKQSVKTDDIKESLKASFDNNTPDVKIYGEDNQVKVTTKYMIDDKSTNTDSIVERKLYEGLLPTIGSDVDFETFATEYRKSSQKVGPTVADDIIWGSVLAIFFSLIGIFLYIFIRFRNWIYGLGGVLSLLHDTLFVLGWYSILWGFLPFSLEIDQAFIAAILTVIGYSINDTVIVYDRIREYKTLYPKRDNLNLINGAMNSTFGRTINTVLTTLVTLVAIFILGGEVIRGFVFAMLIGIGVGTYSSIFIASALVFDFQEWSNKKKSKELK